MDSPTSNLLIADLLLFSHVLFVAFVVFSVPLILIGKSSHWPWVSNPWFRLTHLVAIAVVVIQAWLGVICPLTTWEMAFRARAGDTVYAGTFVSHWLDSILYYRAPAWVFALLYTVFAILVVASWFWVRPHPFGGGRSKGSTND